MCVGMLVAAVTLAAARFLGNPDTFAFTNGRPRYSFRQFRAETSVWSQLYIADSPVGTGERRTGHP